MVQGVPKGGTRCPEQNMERVVPVSNGFGKTTETCSNTLSITLAIAGRLINKPLTDPDLCWQPYSIERRHDQDLS